jgi:hypothetical protein
MLLVLPVDGNFCQSIAQRFVFWWFEIFSGFLTLCVWFSLMLAYFWYKLFILVNIPVVLIACEALWFSLSICGFAFGLGQFSSRSIFLPYEPLASLYWYLGSNGCIFLLAVVLRLNFLVLMQFLDYLLLACGMWNFLIWVRSVDPILTVEFWELMLVERIDKNIWYQKWNDEKNILFIIRYHQ